MHAGRQLSVVLVAAAAGGALTAASASAQPSITFAARACPTFADVPANARFGSALEALGALGRAIRYAPTDLVSPLRERLANRRCQPLPGWAFTLGTSTGSARPSGSPTPLSVVARPATQTIVTRPSAPLTDLRGRRLPGQTIAGATTVALPRRLARASARGRLWAQGGTPQDPLLQTRFGAGAHAFGAFRCAIDNRTGRNIQAIAFPAGTSHVFCFAYYVSAALPAAAAPAARTSTSIPAPIYVTVVKRVAGAPPDFSASVSFTGTFADYYTGGSFAVDVSGQAGQREFTGVDQFPLAGRWTIAETPASDPRMEPLSAACIGDTTTIPGTATATVEIPSPPPAALVTCYFDNRWVPPPAGLQILKRTRGGTGTFHYTVSSLDGTVPDRTLTLTTTREDEYAGGTISDLPPGRYSVTETVDARPGERWTLDTPDGNCSLQQAVGGNEFAYSSQAPRALGSFVVTLPDVNRCELTNTRTALGAITVAKETVGGTDIAGFRIVSPDGSRVIRQSATTTADSTPVTATGEPSDDLDLGTYTIQEFLPDPNAWVLASVVCDGDPRPFTAGQAQVTLTAADPVKHCTFVDAQRRETPPLPVTPAPLLPQSNVVIEKTAVTQRAVLGENVVYRLTATNRGPDRAEDVVVNDDPQAPGTLAGANPSQGRCTTTLPLACYLGALAPGEQANVRVTLEPTRAGVFPNLAVAGLATRDTQIPSGNVAHTRTRVRKLARPRPRPRAPPVTG